MHITLVSKPSVGHTLQTRVDSDVRSALQAVQTTPGLFVVNDTLWYAINDRGKVTPCVVNQAPYISGRFQRGLANLGWQPEKLLAGQKFDAFLEIQTAPIHSLRVPKERFAAFFAAYVETPEGRAILTEEAKLDDLFSRLYHSLATRTTTLRRDTFDPSLWPFLTDAPSQTIFRVGLEFETGNIASSFRAIQKLKGLYLSGHIDAGVFVTSIDKRNCACRIWPSSNRNGSFEELTRRNYRADITFPFWEYGFAPDSFDRSVPYLAGDGTTYQPARTGGTYNAGGQTYSVWTGDRGKEIMLPMP